MSLVLSAFLPSSACDLPVFFLSFFLGGMRARGPRAMRGPSIVERLSQYVVWTHACLLSHYNPSNNRTLACDHVKLRLQLL